MRIEFKGEFTWDLAAVAPYAYWLHKRGQLTETIGAAGSEPCFFFSPKHTAEGERHGGAATFNPLEHTDCVIGGDVYEKDPIAEKGDKWELPPYREHFANDRFVFEKPMLIISNKYTEEWGKAPVNFIPIEIVHRLYHTLGKYYTLVYVRPTYKERGIAYDDHRLYDWFDYDVIRGRYPEIVVFNDLLDANPDLDYNTLQFMLSANCERFISVVGGNATLCNVFGGTNIVYSISDNEHTKCYRNDGYYNTRFGTRCLLITNFLNVFERAYREFHP